MKKIDKLIIDADIARCVSEKEIPVSTNSRKLLNIMLKNRLIFVKNSQLNEEWKKHASRYAKTWLISMISRRLVQVVHDDDAFSNLIDKMDLSDKEKAAGRKDCHLISAATISNAIIASNDAIAFNVFQKASSINGKFGVLYWISPTRNVDEAEEILIANSAIPNHWLISCKEHHCTAV
ncbi:hypothetical protein JD523_12255 [Aeromonas enteropelogenes]|uniref:hypothetical protein n=1 Tax=Aeromonas enteropelogenes TaxID=29489 RepID=UPI00191D2501|nr:hypothetical protein [Aeromonas enteropelogenes]MBL0521669.1 hypothetical protein [Aeromonas enteropelogenes]